MGEAGLGLGWIGRGRIGARLDWVSAGLGVGGLGLGCIEVRLDWAWVDWGAAGLGLGWIGARLDWSVSALGWLGSQANGGGTGGLQVANRCRRVGVWEVHGGCARKGWADLHNWRTLCRCLMLLRALAWVI